MIRKVSALYFSATGTTEKIVVDVAEKLGEGLGCPKTEKLEFTLPSARKREYAFTENDLVVAGVPVYAGRVPNVLLPFLKAVRGNGALAAAVVLYGNRDYDDALIELRDLLKEDGFRVLAGGAFVGEHSFSGVLAKGRPDQWDLEAADEFAGRILTKLDAGGRSEAEVKGETPYRPYYRPRDRKGVPVDIRKVTPKTNDSCTGCMTCVRVCPMGSIDPANPTRLVGICIKCGACIKKCPVGAKYYDDLNYLYHKKELEEGLTVRKEPELFL